MQQQGRPAAQELRARAVLLDVNAPVTSHLEHQLAGVQIAHGLAHRTAVEELKVPCSCFAQSCHILAIYAVRELPTAVAVCIACTC
jgi:hypothetical protein